MAHFGSRIRALRAEKGLSQEEFAQQCGLHPNTIRKVERTCAAPDEVKDATKVCLAHGLGMSLNQLEALYHPTVQQNLGDPNHGIPIINRVPAGEPVDYEHMELDNGIGNDYIPRIGSGVNDPTAFAFSVVGDSMTPEFCEGDTVVCSPSSVISDGDAVFVRFGSERDHTCTFKRVFDRGDEVELLPDNRRYTPMIVLKEQIDRMAKVVAKWVRYD
jgi:SOS-response transcriptional repressor LexA